MKKLVYVLLCLTLVPQAFSKIDLDVVGNTRTKKDVVRVEISEFLSQDSLSQADLKEIERRIWNLRVFSDVKIENKKNKLSIIVKERWTTIPIAKFTGGGGTSYIAAGVYDINSFGSNMELGAQYESLNDRPAGVAWIRKPQFLGDRNLRAGIDIWSINRVRFFFDQETGDDAGAFTLQRQRFNSFIEKRWQNDFYTLGFNFEYQGDEISEMDLTDELLEQNDERNYEPDEKSTSRWYTAYLQVGRINFKNYLVEGSQISLRSSLVAVSDDTEAIQNLSANSFTFQYFNLFKDLSNFAWQFRLNNNNLRQIQNFNYLGGFEEVRGYMDGQYFDNASWQNNIEYRFNLFERGWLVVQGAVFSDQGKEGSDIDNLINREEEILLSSGAGIRLISPQIFRFVARLDFAQTHTRSKQQGISFGIQQFF